MTNTIYLITGANRGIGKALVAAYLARSNNTVIASTRDPNSASSLTLNDLPKAAGSEVILVKIESASSTDAAHAVALLQSQHRITHVDVVIANAGIANSFARADEAKAEDLLEHFNVNVIGTLYLLQAVLPLLKKSSNGKFVSMSTAAATIGGMEGVIAPNIAYGASKAALNYLTKKIHMENPEIVAFPVHPGWVQTEMGNRGAVAYGLDKAPDTVEDSIAGLVKVIDGATRDTASGKFLTFEGEIMAW